MSGYLVLAACPRCGAKRRINPAQWATPCGECVDLPVEPTPISHIPKYSKEEGDRVIHAINTIALAVQAAARRRYSSCCDDCGCLLLDGERCPNCALLTAGKVGAA